MTKGNSYVKILETIFFSKYKKGLRTFEFERDEIQDAAIKIGVSVPKNLGDVIYSSRYRTSISDVISKTAPEGFQWTIEGAGRGKYRFRLVRLFRLIPNSELCVIKIPDATPEIIVAYAQKDEQALLAKVRYNRLVDIFLGITTYSLQNHLRTSVPEIGQIEIDEVYVGLDKSGTHYVVPIQAKGGNDQSSVIQTRQDIAWCKKEFPDLLARPVTAQFMQDGVIALFELVEQDGDVKIADERHYKLVAKDEINAEDLSRYRMQLSRLNPSH